MTAQVYFDTNFFITTFEVAGAESVLGWAVMSALEVGAFAAVTSELTLAELLPKPMSVNDRELVATYTKLLTQNPVLKVVPVTRSVLVSAANLRAADRTLKLPDAIHLATALAQSCTFFLTQDLRLRAPRGVERIHLTATTLEQIARRTP